MRLKSKSKAQLSMEYMIIFGVVVAAVLTLTFFIPKNNRTLEESNVAEFGNLISSEINTAVKRGVGNSKRVQTIIPERIEGFYYKDSNLVVVLDGKTYEKEYYSVHVPVVGEIVNGAVYVEYFDSPSNFVCVYPVDNRKDCCIDFMCSMSDLS